MTRFLTITLVIGFGASLLFNMLFNLTASATGRRTGSIVSFSAVARLGLLFWVITMVLYGLMSLGV